MTQVAFVKTQDRQAGVDKALDLLEIASTTMSGHFTLSLKNSVGLAAKWVPGESYNCMHELHSFSHQRRMIAEINAAYQPDLIVLDGVEAFVDGGPDRGTQVAAQVILAGTDRVAVDAVGEGSIFEQEKVARGVELDLGVESPEQIELVTDDPDSEAYAVEIHKILVGR